MKDARPSVRESVRIRVAEELAHRRWNTVDLARAANIDVVTVSTFLSGEVALRATRSKIEAAFGLPPGTLGLLSADSVDVRKAESHPRTPAGS